ncbi:MAG: DUF2157 domain-containing protein [Pacificimonas sp.]|jgi:uncharacterized membrane protein|nr:DUF2157 domain-containing protein [Pacificimonas sp.]
MGMEDRIELWERAGVIDTAAAARIRAFEAERARPLWLWSIAALGGLAIALGIVALIAANWATIPDGLKLAVHMALLIGAGALVWRARQQDQLWTGEIALIVFTALIVGGLGLQAQIYQLTGDIWRLFATWLVLAAPTLLLAGRTRVSGYLLAGVASLAVVSAAMAMDGSVATERLVQGLAAATPWILVAVSSLRADPFGQGLRKAGLAALLLFASFIHLTWAGEISSTDASRNLIRLLPVGLAVAAAIFGLHRRPVFGPALALPLLLGTAIAVALATVVPHPDAIIPRFIGALIFAAMWIWIAIAAARADWSGLYRLAVAALAIRLFLVYFELFGSQATTGLGLIVAGFLLIGLAWGTRRLFRVEAS